MTDFRLLWDEAARFWRSVSGSQRELGLVSLLSLTDLACQFC